MLDDNWPLLARLAWLAGAAGVVGCGPSEQTPSVDLAGYCEDLTETPRVMTSPSSVTAHRWLAQNTLASDGRGGVWTLLVENGGSGGAAGGTYMAAVHLDEGVNETQAGTIQNADVQVVGVPDGGAWITARMFGPGLFLGETTLAPVGYDVRVARLNAAGHVVARAQFQSDRGCGHQELSPASADDGSLYLFLNTCVRDVTGADGIRDDVLTLSRVNADGQIDWTVELGDGRNPTYDLIAVKDDGTVALAGRRSPGSSESQLHVALLDQSGAITLERTLFTEGEATMTGFVASGDGFALTGNTSDTIVAGDVVLKPFRRSHDAYLLWIDANLVPTFGSTYGGAGADLSHAISAGANGEVWLTGNFEQEATFGGPPLSSDGSSAKWGSNYSHSGWEEVFVARFGADGTHLGSRSLGAEGRDHARAVIPSSGSGAWVVFGPSSHLESSGSPMPDPPSAVRANSPFDRFLLTQIDVSQPVPELNPLAPEPFTRFHPPEGATWFGGSPARFGDTLAVGSKRGVELFRETEGQRVHEATATLPSDATTLDAFVLTDRWVIIGSVGTDYDGEPGRVFVYARDDLARGSSSAPQTILVQRDGEDGDEHLFGRSLALVGRDLLVIGADGAVVTFDLASETPTRVERVTPPSGYRGGTTRRASLSLAAAGADLFVGDRYSERSREGSGEVFHYRVVDGALKLSAKLGAGDAAPFAEAPPCEGHVCEGRPRGEEFGGSLSFDGSRLVVGAANTGGVYVFEREGASFIEAQRIHDRYRLTNLGFGSAHLAISGDWLAIGTERHDIDVVRSAGVVDLFVHDDGTWKPAGRVHSAQPWNDGRFGSGLVFDGNALLIGAPGDPESGTLVSLNLDVCASGGCLTPLDCEREIVGG